MMSLEKKDLENLYHLDKEIDDLDRQIFELSERIYRKGNMVSDTIKDYSNVAKGKVVIISGYNHKKFAKQMKALTDNMDCKKSRYLDQRTKIELELDRIEDAEIRRIVRLRYLERLEWEIVARRIGPYATADACRIKLDRFLGA